MAWRTLLDEFNSTGEIPAEYEVVVSFQPIEEADEPEVRCPSCNRVSRASMMYDLEPPGVPPANRVPDSFRRKVTKGKAKGLALSRYVCDQCLAAARNWEVHESGDLGNTVTKADVHAVARAADRRGRDRIGGSRADPPGLSRPWSPGYRRADDHPNGKGPPEVHPGRGRGRG